MKKQTFIVEIEMPDGDFISAGWLKDLIQQDCDNEQNDGRQTVSVRDAWLPSNLDEAAEEYGRKEYSHAIHFWDEGLSKNKPEVMKEDFVDAFKAGAEWMAGQGVKFDTEMSWLDSFGFQIGCPEDTSIFDCFNEGDKVVVQIRKKQ